jgi:xanthine/uracil permease
MASAASILIGIIAGFIVAAMLGEVRWEKIAAADWFASQCLYNME